MLLNKNLIGFMLCLLITMAGFFLAGNVGIYFNLSGILIVIGGTFGCALISYRLERLAMVYKVIVASYRHRVKEPREIVDILIDLAVKSRFSGILSLQEDEQETSILFLRGALGLLVDGRKPAEIQDILNSEMYFFKMRRDDSERMLRTIANYFPPFGLIGSIVGLVAMMAGVGDPKVIMASVPIALTATLYGLVFSNFFFLPFAANLAERTSQELLLQRMILEGVLAIQSEMNPHLLETKLKSFLTPSSRSGQVVSLAKIQQRFKIKAENGTKGARSKPVMEATKSA
jgi:chemotaxis protein MotA